MNKSDIVRHMRHHLTNSDAVVAFDHSSLSAGDLRRLRARLPRGSRLSVVKNSLARLASEDIGIRLPLTGPTMLLFVNDDHELSSATKTVLTDCPAKGGFYRDMLDVPACHRISNLSPRATQYSELARVLGLHARLHTHLTSIKEQS